MGIAQTVHRQESDLLGRLGGLWRRIISSSSPAQPRAKTPSQLRRVEILEEIQARTEPQSLAEWRAILREEFNTAVHALHACKRRRDPKSSGDIAERLRAISSALNAVHVPRP